MRHGMSVAACVRTLLLSLLIVGGLAPVGAQAQDRDWSSTAEPLSQLSQAQVAETGHVLIFSETAAFRHSEAIAQGVPALRAAFEAAEITSEHTEDSAIFNDADLERFDA